MTPDDTMEQQRSSIRDSVLTEIARRRTRRRRRIVVGAAGGALLIVAGVAIGATQFAPVSPAVQTGAAACYESDDANAEPHRYLNTDGEPYDVVELCSQFWQYGQFGQTPPAEPDDFSHEYSVPPIAVCLASDGLPSGFPIWDDETEKELCDRLGFPVYDE